MAAGSDKAGRASGLRAFITSEAGGGLLLMCVAALALLVANSPLAPVYFGLLKSYVFGLSILHWINDALMAGFFLLVGLEIKREILTGELSTWSRRALPGIAALGGMVVPALIYAACNAGDAVTMRGWAIPTATDIAFALGVLALLGSRVPASLKIFLTALAIIDDLGAVMIIALFYTANLSLDMLGLAILGLIVLGVMNKAGVTRIAPYLLVGVLVWFFVLRSGVHATLAGVALAMTIPLGVGAGAQSPLQRLEHALHPWVAYAIVPIFGFANAGVSLAGTGPQTLVQPVPLGILLGLFIGKQVGVFGFAWAALRLGLAELPARASHLQIYGVSLLCGIGFTMSLFIAALAFESVPALNDAAKIGVLAGSIISASAGWLVLRLAGQRQA